MIRLFVYSLLAIVVALWVTLYLGFPGDPGYMLIAFGSYTFETSLFALLVAVIVLFLLVRLLLLLLDWINPMRLLAAGKQISHRRRTRSNSIEGLLYFTRGSWQSSLNLLKRGMNEKDATVINYLAAAFAAYEVGDKEGGMQFLDNAQAKFPTARSTINSLRAQLLYKSGQLEQCLAVLEQTKKNSLNDPALMTLLKDVYVKLEDWTQLEELLPGLEKNKIVDKAEARQIHKRIFMENLYKFQAAANAKGEEGLGKLHKTWKKAPQPYKEDAKVVKHYVDLLLKLDDQEEAAKAIEYALGKTWHVELVQRYGAQGIGDSARQLLVAENWLHFRPSDADLLLSLARISMRNQLWGKAREYYETSLKISPSAEAYGELGRLLKHLGEIEAAESYLKNYDELVGTQLSNLPMPERDKITH